MKRTMAKIGAGRINGVFMATSSMLLGQSNESSRNLKREIITCIPTTPDEMPSN